MLFFHFMRFPGVHCHKCDPEFTFRHISSCSQPSPYKFLFDIVLHCLLRHCGLRDLHSFFGSQPAIARKKLVMDQETLTATAT